MKFLNLPEKSRDVSIAVPVLAEEEIIANFVAEFNPSGVNNSAIIDGLYELLNYMSPDGSNTTSKIFLQLNGYFANGHKNNITKMLGLKSF